jgi:hypothetical protein
MKFKEIFNPSISDDGNWVVYNAQPDRGNGEVIVYDTGSAKSHVIARGSRPVITYDGKWTAAFLKPDALTMEKTKKKEKLKQGLALLETVSGKTTSWKRVKKFAFSDDSKWLALQFFPEEEDEKNDKAGDEKKKKKSEWDEKAATLILRHLSTGKELQVGKTLSFAFDPASRYIAYSTYSGEEAADGIFIRSLNTAEAAQEKKVTEPGAVFNNLSWSKKKSKLAFLLHYDQEKTGAKSNNRKNKAYAAGIYLWDGMTKKIKPIVTKAEIPAGWMLPAENNFTWTKDESRLFFGFKPTPEYLFYKKREMEKSKKQIEEEDLFCPGYLLEKRQVDVWHYLDPRINPQQKKMWERDKKRTYLAVYHLKQKSSVPLADKELPFIQPVENPKYALGRSQGPYLREMTWEGQCYDVYLIDLTQGIREKILIRHRHHASLSPEGKFVIYYRDKHWHLYNTLNRETRNLTANFATPFYDEDHDYPSAVPGYGIAGWLEKDKAVFIYDKYDIWRFPTGGGKALKITGGKGREAKIAFRIIKTDPEQKFFTKKQELLLSAYSHEKKHMGFYSSNVEKSGVSELTSGKHRYNFLKKARKADRIIYTRENFSEFPDIRISDSHFRTTEKISDLNPQIKDFLWGTPRLIEWLNLDGNRLQGIVILPENYDKNKRYPVLVYYYRFFTDRLYEFNRMVINHRPNFPFYVSNGYVMFLT